VGPVGVASGSVDELAELLSRAASAASEFRATLAERPVAPTVDLDAVRKGFGGALQDQSLPPSQVLDELVNAADGGLVASAGPRYFGFVIGGSQRTSSVSPPRRRSVL
jgi:hypothetical protein